MGFLTGCAEIHVIPNVRLFLRSSADQAVQIKGAAVQLEVEEHQHGMRQDLANEAMLIMPQVVDAEAGHRKALGQV